MSAAPNHKQSASWLKRQAERKKADAIKSLDREIKAEAEAERERRREAIRARRLKAEEKARMERMSEKMSQKKLMRLKKRQGRTKMIAG